MMGDFIVCFGLGFEVFRGCDLEHLSNEHTRVKTPRSGVMFVARGWNNLWYAYKINRTPEGCNILLIRLLVAPLWGAISFVT